MTKFGAVSNLLLIAIVLLFNIWLFFMLTSGPYTLNRLPEVLYSITLFALVPALVMLAATAWIKHFSPMLLFFVVLTIAPVLVIMRGQRLDRDGSVVMFLMQIFISYGSAILLGIVALVLWTRSRA